MRISKFKIASLYVLKFHQKNRDSKDVQYLPSFFFG